MTTNNRNNTAKRTATQINSILKAFGIESKSENLGNGNNFCIENTLFNRVNLKKAGFILHLSNVSDKTVVFSCF
jgi:hypothetical protein